MRVLQAAGDVAWCTKGVLVMVRQRRHSHMADDGKEVPYGKVQRSVLQAQVAVWARRWAWAWAWASISQWTWGLGDAASPPCPLQALQQLLLDVIGISPG